MKHYTVQNVDGISVGGAGEIPDENVGVKCYRGLNCAVELVLSHLIDTSGGVCRLSSS